ncbi:MULTISPECIES: cache domain-containing protein [unclassified Novosphingobium]|uniref:cache domain-containing protein n=1 Tax=unclassified Novosphingobium TaxID=2644732 RepID=UPI0014948B91|nr:MULTISPECIES: cache domain-containing protein [unclassified Novosphingobium]MBB3359618.1 cytochrome c [Novosphingobium sp. BK256]MBB3376016.1 cytochrome c [Novosphingobium sp. BK280]MBB3380391.1 cytochrome c [Novosphingobium sp. BK258]MBB3422043.1 cytochrome c [Novosphingobium sp. BK267]MBB3450780.1 cytochrome c [Novosphingobium sp. BK352]
MLPTFPRLILACAMACVTVPLASVPAQAAAHAGSADAQALLSRAVAEVKGVGAPKAFAEFNDPNGPFHTRELYVFVFSMTGRYEASGADPKLAGSDVSAMTDAEGRPFVQDMIALAKAKDGGRVDYVWLNRVDNRVEHKRSLVQRVGDHIVGVGYYAG